MHADVVELSKRLPGYDVSITVHPEMHDGKPVIYVSRAGYHMVMLYNEDANIDKVVADITKHFEKGDAQDGR